MSLHTYFTPRQTGAPRLSRQVRRLASVRASATANSRFVPPPMSYKSVKYLCPRAQAISSAPPAVTGLRSRCARPHSTACSTARQTLSHDVRKIEPTSLQLSLLAQLARYQRYVVVSWFLPSHHGTISTVPPPRLQSTRRIRYARKTKSPQIGTYSNRRSSRRSYAGPGRPQPEQNTRPFFRALIWTTSAGPSSCTSRRDSPTTNGLNFST